MNAETAPESTETGSKDARVEAQARAAHEARHKSPSPRHFRLTTLGAVRRELGSIYWDAKDGTRSIPDAARLAYILQTLDKVLLDATLEDRVVQLEELNHGK